MRMGKISVVEAWCLAHQDFYGGHLLFSLQRQNVWKMELSTSWLCPFLSLPAKTGPLLETRIYQRITTFVLFVLLVFVYCYDCLGKALVFFLIEVGRIAMGSARVGSEIPLSIIFIMTDRTKELLFFFQRGRKENEQDVLDLTLVTRLEKKTWLDSHSA